MINIVEVKNKKQLKQFVEFPNKLYKGNKYYCPPMAQDEFNTFLPDKNPAFDYCESRQFLAYKDGKLVGRIAGIINQAHIERQNKKQIRFARFDAIDDIEVSKALFDAVKQYGVEKGMDEMIGPLGFSDTDREGMLIDGFNEKNLSITIYNHPYYQEHMKLMGFDKEADWVEYQLKMPKEIDPRLIKICNRVKERYGYQVKKFKNQKELQKYAKEALNLVNEAFNELYAYVPLTDKMIDQYLKDYIPIVNKDYVIVVVDKNDKVIGFGLMVPSLAEACRKHNGHLFPFGWISFLKALKSKSNKILEMYFVAVKPEYQSTGVNALIMVESIKAGFKNKAEIAETGPELELNEKVQDQWKGFDARQHRRRRSWIVKLDEMKLK